jgi:hypothetical protein
VGHFPYENGPRCLWAHFLAGFNLSFDPATCRGDFLSERNQTKILKQRKNFYGDFVGNLVLIL